MAVLDRERNVIVLRIVYDGPAGAGKTATARSLSGRLNRPSYSPEELGDRTLYFDWVDYTGGRFEGYQLRCQVVTVPGQVALGHRRRLLLSTADVVVQLAPFTADTLQADVHRLRDLVGQMAAAQPFPVGVVAQANKRDLPEAVSIDQVRAALAEASLDVRVVETVATRGEGVREAFVFAVRVALDRVREMLRRDMLEARPPAVDSPDALLTQLLAHESEARERGQAPSMADSALNEVVRSEHAAQSSPPAAPRAEAAQLPRAPEPSAVPSGLVWPPIGGRAQLAEACAAVPAVHLEHDHWIARTGSGWTLFSAPGARYPSAESGRAALIGLARAHAQAKRWLSFPRVVVLAPDGPEWRLWQAVRQIPTLREWLIEELPRSTVLEAARRVTEATRRAFDFHSHLVRTSAGGVLRASLDSLGVYEGRTVYTERFPLPGETDATQPAFELERELRPILEELAQREAGLRPALERVRGSSHHLDAAIADRLLQALA